MKIAQWGYQQLICICGWQLNSNPLSLWSSLNYPINLNVFPTSDLDWTMSLIVSVSRIQLAAYVWFYHQGLFADVDYDSPFKTQKPEEMHESKMSLLIHAMVIPCVILYAFEWCGAICPLALSQYVQTIWLLTYCNINTVLWL